SLRSKKPNTNKAPGNNACARGSACTPQSAARPLLVEPPLAESQLCAKSGIPPRGGWFKSFLHPHPKPISNPGHGSGWILQVLSTPSSQTTFLIPATAVGGYFKSFLHPH